MPTNILWFRKNLRTYDNPALLRASESSERLICVFIYDEITHYEQHGVQSLGPYRANFLWESLTALKSALKALGNDLIILKGDAAEVLKDLASQTDAKKILAPHECGHCEQLQETAIKKFCELEIVGGATLLDIHSLPSEPASLPNSYILFRRMIETNWDEQVWAVPACYESPQKLPPPPEKVIIQGLDKNPVADSRPTPEKAVMKFDGGEVAALRRLNAYIWSGNALENYKETRNQLLGEKFSSKFSPWLANGCLSPRHVYHEIRRFEKEKLENESTRWLICQLLWRDYYHFASYKHGADLFLGGGMRGQSCSKKEISITQSDKIQKWCQGKTGQRFVDANMTELLETGYMSNRGRQSVALYLVKDLDQDWRLGASWFEHYLLDFEPCNNYGNWNFQAGIGHDLRKSNGFKIENEAQRHDPLGTYQDYWLGSVS